MSHALKYPGGKSYLSATLARLAPPHTHRVYGCAGGLSEIVDWPADNVSEVANDIDLTLTNFWRVLQDDKLTKQFRRRVEAIPFSEPEWLYHKRRLESGLTIIPDLELAVSYFVCCRQSFSGGLESFAPITRNRTRRRMNEQVSAWIGAIQGLEQVYQRIRRILVVNGDVCEIIRTQDGPKTLFYLDPTYLNRKTKKLYRYEMDIPKHQQLLAAIKAAKGMVMISNYRNLLYDDWLSGWHRHDVNLVNHMSGQKRKSSVVESIWMNFEPHTEGDLDVAAELLDKLAK